MKTLLLCACLLAGHGGDREKGLQLYREGRFAEAAAAFRSAIEREGDSADLEFNLALASWRAGDLAAAETAVEKYAALAADARTELHAGLLGALRYDEAKAFEAQADALIAGGGAPPAAGDEPADPLPLLEQALQKAVQSQVYFLRAIKAKPVPELLRNVERVLRTIDELKKKIEELVKQRKEQQKDDDKKDGEKDDKKKDEEKKQDEKKDDKKDEKKDDKGEPKNDQQKQDEKKDPQQSDPQQQQGDEKPEPKQGEPKDQKGDEGKPPAKPEEAKPGETPPSQPEPKPGEQKDQQPRTDAPGEVAEGKELSPEQTQRLLEQLQDLDAKMRAFRARAKTGRRPVERDW